MHTREIPKAEWGRYLDELSRARFARRVRVEVDGAELGEQALTDTLPLVGIAFDHKGHAAISLTVESPRDGAQLTHEIPDPTHVYAAENDQGELAVLDIENGARVKTLVFFEETRQNPVTH